MTMARMLLAEVAAVYDVTPQAVELDPQGRDRVALATGRLIYQIPLSALQRDERFDVARARRLQVTLERRHEGQPEVSSDEMLRQMRSRRPTSQ